MSEKTEDNHVENEPLESATKLPDESLKESTEETYFCNIPGCVTPFKSIKDFESHYKRSHQHRCSTCKKQLASAHFLDLHIQETHDSFFAAQAERKPMFACFVEICQEKFKDAEERREHCIEKHKFPKNFHFEKTSGKKPDEKKQTEKKTAKVKPPKFFHFGHQPAKTFTRPKKSVLESDTVMKELQESLPDAS